MLGLTKKISLGINGDAQATAVALLDALRAEQPDRARDEARIARIAEERDDLGRRAGRAGRRARVTRSARAGRCR